MTNNKIAKKTALIVVAHFGGGVIAGTKDPIAEGEHRAVVKIAMIKACGKDFERIGTNDINIADAMKVDDVVLMTHDDLTESPQVGATFALLRALPNIAFIAQQNKANYIDLVVDIYGVYYLNSLIGVIGRPGKDGGAREFFNPYERGRIAKELDVAVNNARELLTNRKSEAKGDVNVLVDFAAQIGKHMEKVAPKIGLMTSYCRQWQYVEARLKADEPLYIKVTKSLTTGKVAQIIAENENGDEVTVEHANLTNGEWLLGGVEYDFSVEIPTNPICYTAERIIPFKLKGETTRYVSLSTLFAKSTGIAERKEEGLGATIKVNETPSRDWFIAKYLGMWRAIDSDLFNRSTADTDTDLDYEAQEFDFGNYNFTRNSTISTSNVDEVSTNYDEDEDDMPM